MKKLLFGICIIFFINARAQEFNHFRWQGDSANFSTDKLKIKDAATKKIIFDGFKESKIRFSSGLGIYPTLYNVYVKIGGYLTIENGEVLSFDYKVDKTLATTIIFGITEDNQIAQVALLYNDAEKIIKIIVAAKENYLKKDNKILVFELSGFE